MFTLPNFDLTVNVWRNSSNYLTDPPDVVVFGNLANGRRDLDVYIGADSFPAANFILFGVHQLLLPTSADVRGINSTTDFDHVEVPAGTGYFYVVKWLQWAGRGYANQHKVALINQVPPWPTPFV